MTSLKHNFAIINNGSESSGGASVLEKPSDFETFCLVKPPSYDNEVTVTTSYSISDTMTSTKSEPSNELNNDADNMRETDSFKLQQDLVVGRSINSSQESPFEGFGSSPIGKLHNLFYAPGQAQHPQSENENLPLTNNKLPQPAQKLSPGKILFSKFYDTIIEENSCNAVDIKMSTDTGKSNLYVRRRSAESYDSNNSDMNTSSELSFNGKIKSLNSTHNLTKTYHDQLEHTDRLTSLIETTLNNSQQFSESFILKKYSNEKSPDLFGDDDDYDDQEAEVEEKHMQNLKSNGEHKVQLNESRPLAVSCNLADNSFNCPTESSFANDDHTMDCNLIQGSSGISSNSYTLFKDNCRRERDLHRRIRKCLAGVLPPPSVTIPQLDMVNTVLLKKQEIFNFINDIKDESLKQIALAGGMSCNSSRPPSLFRPTHTLEETKNISWRDILSVRQHGLCYNINRASESNEYLSLSVMERFIGAETASSYVNSPSSAKKRSSRLKLLCQSPGNRLSHLAKRRAIFSSANLATQKTNSLVGPQILLDKKKIKNRRKGTPKRMTPASKKKNRKTPSSSARKRFMCSEIVKPGPSRETSKRALFQSPAKQQVQQKLAVPKPPCMKPDLANRVEKSKRALLFTPEKQHKQNEQKTLSSSYFAPATSTQLDMLLKRKRNRCDDNDDVDTSELTSQNNKLFKTDGSTSLTPRALKIKSESFCIGAGSSTKPLNDMTYASSSLTINSNLSLCSTISNTSSISSLSSAMGAKLQKSYSDNVAPTNSMTENQKKKLLWAVSQALQERKITTKHESFKQYASILARVVRRIFQEFFQKTSTSNSETMLRLAKKYSYAVTTGSTADDIYLQAKIQIEHSKRQSTTRLSGYIGPEEYQQLKQHSLQSLPSQSQTLKGSTQSVFTSENSFDSFGMMSQTSSSFCGSMNVISVSQTSFLGQISQMSQDITNIDTTQNLNAHSATKNNQTNTSLQNSSSKSNLCGVVLRENVDCEVRRSGQKNFTGKDQRNMSPHTGANNGSAAKPHTQLVTDITINSTKARRQITFDS